MAERKPNTRRTMNGILSFIALAAILALFFQYRYRVSISAAPHFSVALRHLPYYAFCSFYRMLAAYIISLIFSIIYGLAATRGRLWERIMIPAIDIAQSVPVVGFFPAAVFFFVALAHGSRLGVEMAAIFLIFTSQAWNMTLGVFEAIRTIPNDSLRNARGFRRAWMAAAAASLFARDGSQAGVQLDPVVGRRMVLPDRVRNYHGRPLALIACPALAAI